MAESSPARPSEESTLEAEIAGVANTVERLIILVESAIAEGAAA